MASTTSASPLTADWIVQLRQLQQSLRDDPHCSQAWRWRIRVKVLTYLVLRYGADPVMERRAANRPALPFSALRDMMAGYGSPPRTRRELRQILNRIAEINLLKVDLSASGRRA